MRNGNFDEDDNPLVLLVPYCQTSRLCDEDGHEIMNFLSETEWCECERMHGVTLKHVVPSVEWIPIGL